MEIPNTTDLLHKSFAVTEKIDLVQQEESVEDTGLQAQKATQVSDDQAYYTREEELIMEAQFEELRQEEKRDAKNNNDWFLQNMFNKA